MTETTDVAPATAYRVVPHPEGVVVEVVPDAPALARRVADRVGMLVAGRPDARLAFPTGRTPVRLYDELVRRVAAGALDLGGVSVFELDEFLGLDPDHPASFARWLREKLLDPAGVAPDRFHPVPAAAPDPAAAALAFERGIAAVGGLDLALLGIGNNGHVAFNEPGSSPDSRTRVLRLTQESIDQTAADWPVDDPVPSMAMTMGIATLLDARQLLVMASGPGKADVLRDALTLPPSPDLPATLLRVAGPRLVVVADEPAVALLDESD